MKSFLMLVYTCLYNRLKFQKNNERTKDTLIINYATKLATNFKSSTKWLDIYPVGSTNPVN